MVVSYVQDVFFAIDIKALRSVCVQNDAGELYICTAQNRISFFGGQDLRSWSPNMLTAGLTRCFATDLPHSATSTSRF